MKKKSLIVITFFLLNNIFSQTYQFDYLIKDYMENHKNGYKNANDHFYNSKDKSYYGRFSKSNIGYWFMVYDYGRSLVHTFEIAKTDSPSDGSKYIYKNSGYYLPNEKLEKEQKAQVYTHTFIEDISGGKKMILKKFKNEKAKKADVEMTGDFIKIDSDLRAFSYVELFNTRADLVKLEDNETYYLRDAKWKVKDSEGEYHTNIYKIPLTITLDSSKIKLPKEKPKSAEEQIEEWKKTIVR